MRLLANSKGGMEKAEKAGVCLTLYSWLKVWQSASEIAEAYQIGRMESQAALRLLQSVDPEIVGRLSVLVQRRGSFLFPFISERGQVCSPLTSSFWTPSPGSIRCRSS